MPDDPRAADPRAADPRATAAACLAAAYDGSMRFPAIVGALMAAGFEG